jgi:hypothetical protein
MGASMQEQPLKSELDRVESELTSARVECAILAARIAGLEATHAALTEALSASRPSASDIANRRADVIADVLKTGRKEMSVDDVVKVLLGDGRAHVTADGVGADLEDLAEHGRATRVRSGVYAFRVPD